MPDVPSTKRSSGGFTLLEVLVALAIVAIAIFPLLQLTQEAEQSAFDAKFTIIATSATKVLLSERLALIDPGESGESGQGDLSQLAFELDELELDMDYSVIEYEWEIEEIDLSEDVASAEEDPNDPNSGTDPGDGTGGDDTGQGTGGQNDDDEIDERFRARYARITIYYRLDDDLEKEMTTETFLPPIPREEDQGLTPIDSVPPNNGP